MKSSKFVGESPPIGIPVFSLVISAFCLTGMLGLLKPSFLDLLLKTEHWTADWRTALLSDRITTPHDKIALVTFNSDSLAGRPTQPVPRDLHAGIIRLVDNAGARAIGLDFYFVQPTDPDKDRDFLDAIRKAKSPVIVGAVNESAEQFKDYQLDYQRRFVLESERQAGYINLRHDRDDVVRYTSPPVAKTLYPESFASLLAQAAGITLRPSLAPQRIAWLWGAQSNPQPFLTIPARDLLGNDSRARELQSQLKNKIVLTGIDLPYTDPHRTPLSIWTGEPMLGIAVHAQILAQLLDGRRFSEFTASGSQLFLLIFALFGATLGWCFWRRRVNFLSIGVATAFLVAIDALLFSWLRFILPFTLALYVWFVSVTAGHHFRRLVFWLSTLKRSHPSRIALQVDT
jgi:adenylate cyclase